MVWVCECGERGERGGIYGRVNAVKIQGCEPPPLCTLYRCGPQPAKIRTGTSPWHLFSLNWHSFEKASGAVLPE